MNEEYYWSITIQAGLVQAAIWTIEEKTVRIITASQPVAWEVQEDVVEAANSALSSAVVNFPEDTEEPSKTVFGVPPSWVTEGQIKKEYLGTIRELCSKLSLTPSGFVVIPEAIAHNVKVEEGSPLTGVIVGIDSTSIDVTLFKLGNLAGTVTVGRSVSLVDDVIEGLARFSVGEHLPSRFLLYNGKDGELEECRQALVQADWSDVPSDKIKFLHTPQIEIVDSKKKSIAVSLAGASEIGEITSALFEEEEAPINTEEESSGDSFNITPEDINIEEGQDITPEDVGFVLGEDVGLGNATAEPVAQDFNNQAGVVNVPTNSHTKKLPSIKFPSLSPFLTKFKRSFSGVIPRKGVGKPVLPEGSLPGSGRKRALLIGLVGVILVVVGLLYAWWTMPRATLTIYISPETLTEEETIVVDESISSTNVSERTIPGNVVTAEVAGEKTLQATGKKTVGDKATGKVKIYNSSAASVRLPSGTVLLGPNDLKFSLDETASVSAAEDPRSPGTATVSVTAEDIGSEYNLGKDEEFKVGNYPKSEVDAVSEEDFSGGSSREIVAVSEEDLDRLEEELTSELLEEAGEKLSGQMGTDKKFIQESVRTEDTDADFSQKAGDEASSVKLSLSLTAAGVWVEKSAVNSIGREIMKDRVPGGYVLRDEQIQIDFSLDDEEGGKWYFDANFKANLLPEINPEEVGKSVAGKSPARAKEIMSTIPGYSRAEVKVKPALPGFFGAIPRVHDHISVEVVAER